ncbi:MAG: phosphoglycerate mutase family protein [Aequorivita sp.]
MKPYLLILLLPFFTFCGQEKKENADSIQEDAMAPEKEQHATYYLIRHAEKEINNPKNQDPGLNIDGMIRSNAWADYFGPIRLDEIYHTRYIRTKQTISLTSQRKAITPTRYDPNTIYSEEFLENTNGKTVLIVGHSNTIPQLVNKLIGEEKYGEMDDNDYATLYKVTINGKEKKVEVVRVGD